MARWLTGIPRRHAVPPCETDDDGRLQGRGRGRSPCEAAIAASSESGEACNDQIRRAWDDLGFSDEIVDAVTNHVKRGVGRNYLVVSHLEEGSTAEVRTLALGRCA